MHHVDPRLNEDKTQIIRQRTHQQLDKITVHTLRMLNATVPFSTVVKDLGVLDSQLSMTSHTATLSQSCFPPATPQVDQIVTDTGCNTDRNLYTLLLALGWTAGTLYLLVSIVDCYTSCKSTHQNYGDHCFAVQGPRV